MSGWIAPRGGWKVSSDSEVSLNLALLSLWYWSKTPSISQIHIIWIFSHNNPSFTFKNTEKVGGLLHSATRLKVASSYYLKHSSWQGHKHQHLHFQTKVRPGQTLYFGISPHWREVIMNINMYSWLFIQRLLCCLWCPVERVSKQCTINGREQSQRKYQVFFHNCLPCLALP